MAEFPTYEQMAKDIAEKALDEYLINGKTLREWIKTIAEQEPKTDGDCISRRAVLEIIRKCHCEEWIKADIGTPIVALSPFTPKEYKPGHWHLDTTDPDFPRRWYCPHCGNWQGYGEPPYCPWCGKRVLKEGEA